MIVNSFFQKIIDSDPIRLSLEDFKKTGRGQKEQAVKTKA
jgi:hypothetical protein